MKRRIVRFSDYELEKLHEAMGAQIQRTLNDATRFLETGPSAPAAEGHFIVLAKERALCDRIGRMRKPDQKQKTKGRK